MAEGLIYHNYDTHTKKIMLRWALATSVKDMKIRLRKNWLSVLAEREVPLRRNCWWCDEFMIDYDGYGLCCIWRGLCNKKFMNEWVNILNHNWIVGALLALPGVAYGVAGCSWWGDCTCWGMGWVWVWLGRAGQEVGHVIHSTKPYPS